MPRCRRTYRERPHGNRHTDEQRLEFERGAVRRDLSTDSLSPVNGVIPPASAVSHATGRLSLEHMSAYYGEFCAVRDLSLEIVPQAVTAIIGPSGCGKSTFIRTLNRMHELVPQAHVEGAIKLDGEDVYGPDVDPVALRRVVGMVFQRPNPFPTMSVRDNVVAGVRLGALRSRVDVDEVVERSLRRAALWDEVKDKLKQTSTALSGGQQQRLCIARALAVEPEVLLMDEPARRSTRSRRSASRSCSASCARTTRSSS